MGRREAERVAGCERISMGEMGEKAAAGSEMRQMTRTTCLSEGIKVIIKNLSSSTWKNAMKMTITR